MRSITKVSSLVILGLLAMAGMAKGQAAKPTHDNAVKCIEGLHLEKDKCVGDLNYNFGTDTVSNVITLAQPSIHIEIITNGKDILKITDKDDKLMLIVHMDGSIDTGENFDADDTARKFWKALAEAYPSICKSALAVP